MIVDCALLWTSKTTAAGSLPILTHPIFTHLTVDLPWLLTLQIEQTSAPAPEYVPGSHAMHATALVFGFGVLVSLAAGLCC